MRILSGIQPSGALHLGNYFGMMRPAIELQEKGEAFYFIANYHSMTSLFNADERRANTLDVALDFLACGLDPKWDWLASATKQKKAEAYYAFCNHETFYRWFNRVRGSFDQVGFEVTPVSADHPALARMRVLPEALRRLLVELPVMLFQTVEIVVHKPAGR